MRTFFPYRGTADEEAYEILLEWTDNHTHLLFLGPGKLQPFGFSYNLFPDPALPLYEPKPVKLRISKVKELPYVPEEAAVLLIHDGGIAEKIYLPSIGQGPVPWYRLRYDLTGITGKTPAVKMTQTPAGDSNGYAYWGSVAIE